MKNLRILLLTGAIAAIASSCHKERTPAEKLVLKAVACTYPSAPCSILKPGDSARGEYMTFSVPLVNDKGERAGTDDGYALLVDTLPMRYEVTKTFTFPDGSLTLGGVFKPADKSSVFSIWGGTGKYQTARGEVTVIPGPDTIAFELSILYHSH